MGGGRGFVVGYGEEEIKGDKRVKGEKRMPKWLSALLTTVAGSGHVINAASGLVPHEYQIPVGVGLILAQNYIVNLAHAYNPDGTPAAVAYVPPTSPIPPVTPKKD